MKPILREGNHTDLLINGEEFFPCLFNAINEAQTEVIIETFILAEDSVGKELQQTLIKAAKRGLRVEITVDDYGTWDLSHDFVKGMTSAGVKLHIFDPQPKLWGVRLNLFRRLHRKIVVIDQKLAFIGGINYSDDHNISFGKLAKQDYVVKITGPVVADIHRSATMLLMRTASKRARRDHMKRTEVDIPAAIGYVERDNWRNKRSIERQYLLALRLAKKRVLIANAYFFPGYRLLRELRRAAQRGVKVTLILQGQPDMPWVTALSRLLYGYLIRAGVTIYEYCQRPLHGKVAVMDDEWVTVGSSNLDPLSLSLNLEANVVIQDRDLNEKLYRHLYDLSTEHCKPIDMEVAKKGYWWRTPAIFLSFHFLRHFPTLLGWLPAHAPIAKLIGKNTPESGRQKDMDQKAKSTETIENSF